MTKKKSQFLSNLGKIWPYLLVSIVILAVAIVGSHDKFVDDSSDLDMTKIISNNSYVTVDQLSEFYTTAAVADDINLATASVIRTNYESVSIMQDIGQSDSSKVSKPNIIDVSHLERGVTTYVVKEGDTMESIANEYGITTTQIRWSNGLKTEDLEVGQSILVPTSPGIAYKVKKDDTVESLAEKYQSDASAIITLNDLETEQDLKEGIIILLPNGVLPETERPEYTIQTRRTNTSSSSSGSSAGTSYSAAYASGNRYAYGWCTWYAWQWRKNNMGSNYVLPSNMGNANMWARRAAAAGFSVNKTPAYGDVFQTSSGYYGHVGVVTSVNDDGTITISDMNGIAGWGRVGTKTISKSEWSRYNFIHGK